MSLFAEVSQLQAAYCRAIDERDRDRLRALVTDDVEFVAADGTATVGVDGFMAVFERYWAAAASPGLHFVSNVELLAPAPGEAGVPTYATFHAVSADAAGVVTTTWGRYRDRVVRADDGALRFAAKRIEPWGRVRHPSAGQ
jgi:ketosteroid isomerase-like protein